MRRICGSEASASLGAPRRARRATLCLFLIAAVSLALAGPPAALAAGGSAAPTPQRLWHSYPLDSAHRGQLQTSGRTAAHPTKAPRAAAASSSGLSWPAWLGILVGVLVLITAAYAVMRQLSSRPSPLGDLARRSRRAARRAAAAAAAAFASLTSRARTGGQPSEQPEPVELPLARRRPQRERPRPDALPLSGALLAEANRVATAPAPAKVPPPKAEQAKTREETVLKRKQRTPDRAVQTLKEKRPVAPSAPAQEVGLLKEKLAEPARRRTNGASASPAVTRAPERPPDATACRIEWWRGYVKSEFQARVRRPDGSEAVLFTSPAFRWSKPTAPPEDLPHVARAHSALVAELKAAGWRPSRRGTQWYALELQRRQVPAGAERAT